MHRMLFPETYAASVCRQSPIAPLTASVDQEVEFPAEDDTTGAVSSGGPWYDSQSQNLIASWVSWTPTGPTR